MKKINKKQQKESLVCHVILILLLSIPRCLFAQNLYLGVGEQRFMHFPHLSRFTIGNSSIIRSLKTKSLSRPGEILLKGTKEGLSDLTVWNKDGSIQKKTIHVLQWNNKHLPYELLPLLNTLHEVELIPFQKKILLRGEISNIEELKKIQSIKKAFPSFIHDESIPSESLTEMGYELIKNWTENNKNVGEFNLRKTNQNITLSIQVKNTKITPQILKELESVYPAIEVEMDKNQSNYPSVHFQVYLIEIQKNFMRSIGVQWPDSLQAQLFLLPKTLTLPDNLEFSLNHLETKGSLKILSQPQLVVRSPGEAELFSGGEIPLSHKTKNQSQTNWKSYGLSLKLKVHHADFFGVRIEIETEMSSLDYSISRSEIPGIQSNKMKTHVESGFNKPLLLSGLIQQKNSIQKSGLPFIQNIPLLGSLFSSESFTQNKSELVAILLPQKKPQDISQSSLSKILPEGPIPTPRNWLDPHSENELIKSPNYPWNAFNESNEL